MTGIDSGRTFYAGLLQALTSVMGSAKGYLHEHGPRSAILAARLGAEMGLEPSDRAELVFSAVLSDMGMVGLAEDAWENPAPELSDDVRSRVRKHPQRSQQRVQEIPHFESLGKLVRAHHEWYDGSGYPDGLSGTAIPLGAQILRLADTVTALGGQRPQRGPLGYAEIVEIVETGAGKEFGPDVVQAYLSLEGSGNLPIFDQERYQSIVWEATEHLLPTEVDPLSTNQLLTIVANLIDAKDPYTGGHSRRVALLAVSVADQLALAGEVKSALWALGYLHDLGKLAVPLRVLAKEGKLTDEEFDFIKAHPVDGADILQDIPTLVHLTDGVRHHHERWDGRGYPDGLSGEDIPLVAQIMAVCDAYDAMTSKRAYRDSLGSQFALDEVARERGTQFAPVIADGFLSIPNDIFEGVQGSRMEAFREIPKRVQTLRHIDPRWFTSKSVHPPAEVIGGEGT